MVELTVIFFYQTDNAIRLLDEEEIWIPKSQIKSCDYPYSECEQGLDITIEIPEWIAIEKGLV